MKSIVSYFLTVPRLFCFDLFQLGNLICPLPPGKAYTLLTDHLITSQSLRSEPAQEMWFQVKPSIHISLSGLLGWL